MLIFLSFIININACWKSLNEGLFSNAFKVLPIFGYENRKENRNLLDLL